MPLHTHYTLRSVIRQNFFTLFRKISTTQPVWQHAHGPRTSWWFLGYQCHLLTLITPSHTSSLWHFSWQSSKTSDWCRLQTHLFTINSCQHRPIILILTEHSLAGRSGPRTEENCATLSTWTWGLLSLLVTDVKMSWVSRVSAWHSAPATTGSHSHLHPPRAPLCALTRATRSARTLGLTA